jgi:hypothetical protein
MRRGQSLAESRTTEYFAILNLPKLIRLRNRQGAPLSTIQPVKTHHGIVYIEVVEGKVPTVIETLSGVQIPIPEGAEPTGTKEFVFDTMGSLRSSIAAMASTAAAAFAESAPAEWSVEINIGFKGKSTPIPVILSGEANTSLKVIAKWKKPE